MTLEISGANLRSQDVILTLSRLMRPYGKPAHVRSDSGMTVGWSETPGANCCTY